jgi:phage/plasmid-associated DNA primase
MIKHQNPINELLSLTYNSPLVHSTIKENVDSVVDMTDEEKQNQLKIGIDVEKEHKNLYEIFEKYLENNSLKMPLTEDEFYKTIAEAHIKEIPNYYDLLLKHVENKKQE